MRRVTTSSNARIPPATRNHIDVYQGLAIARDHPFGHLLALETAGLSPIFRRDRRYLKPPRRRKRSSANRSQAVSAAPFLPSISWR